jgi:hypothetical protein
MPKKWFYSHAGQKVVGPCSSTELRKLASSGELVPEDMVRGGRMVRAVKAKRLKGLFATPAV